MVQSIKAGFRMIAWNRNGSQWITMDRNGSQWIAMDRNGSQWIASTRKLLDHVANLTGFHVIANGS